MKTRGLSLIEMIIVLAIIGVLAAVVYPVTRSAIAKSREAACLSQLRTLGTGLQSYLQEHQNIMPELAILRNSKTEDVAVLDTVLLPYVGLPGAFHCAADAKLFEETGSSYSWNHLQSGRRASDLYFFNLQEDRIPLITDKEAWHPAGTNFLNADLSSSNKLRFVAESR